ncbi:hypothetical protein K0T92_18970 [Paenibacillus oenotherae]|uniref:Uncharacterized protein n=1 Tax=Paenibacillus oenotherae TaxID=1435645 RepID=A0ABS7DA97_9BACL|nr:hypothetical protein [Paenibacillus oenotherae]MBW7476801.1 hypothetical protein [Paenibacillus oenotherae]
MGVLYEIVTGSREDTARIVNDSMEYILDDDNRDADMKQEAIHESVSLDDKEESAFP